MPETKIIKQALQIQTIWTKKRAQSKKLGKGQRQVANEHTNMIKELQTLHVNI